MQAFLMICIGLLLASCGGEKQSKSTVAAIESGEKTRMEWQKARRPVEIHIGGMEGTPPAWPQLGVYMAVNATTPEERQAFAGAVFTRKGEVYVSPNRNAVTSDTTAAISVCHPFRKGLGANDTLRLTAPFRENLYGVETSRSIGNAIESTFRLQSSMALLRIVCESDDLRDWLDGITLIGDGIYTEGCYQPYTGRWLDRESHRRHTSGKCELPVEQRQEARPLPDSDRNGLLNHHHYPHQWQRPCVTHHAATPDGWEHDAPLHP